MAQGFEGVFDPALVDDAGGRSLRWLVIPVLLAIGWGIFFGYTAVYLSDDSLQRPYRHGDTVEAEARLAQSALMMLPIPAQAPADLISRAEAAASISPEPTTTDAVPASRAAAPPLPEAVPQSTTGGASVPEVNRPEFVGLWGPTQAACQAPSRRKGYIPAKITLTGAKAGRTICSFRDSRRAGNTWTMAADCSDRGRRWLSQVRLTVDGDRLTWASAKGASAYIRCARRDG
ncbi:MAG: peptidase inhibitor family I36 protein [Methylobacterium sp.]|nr:peptidase inhibitor family I36 protein [Methylobacterium sp.]